MGLFLKKLHTLSLKLLTPKFAPPSLNLVRVEAILHRRYSLSTIFQTGKLSGQFPRCKFGSKRLNVMSEFAITFAKKVGYVNR